MLLTRPDGTPIKKWEDWTRPKKDYQWQPGRSAMELAKAWFGAGDKPSPPEELLRLLSSNQRIADLEFIRGTSVDLDQYVYPMPLEEEERQIFLQREQKGT